ncbi:MAG: MarR family winged helix-turn-helix transcriptional regulator [Ferrimicrobium sp.]
MTASTPPAEALDSTMFRLGQELRRLRVSIGDDSAYAIGTSFWQLTLLHDRGKLRVSEIATALNLDISTVSRQLKSLSTQGLIERIADESDARAAFIALTPDGRKVLHTLAKRRRCLIEAALSTWDSDDSDALMGLLARFANDLSQALDAQEITNPK